MLPFWLQPTFVVGKRAKEIVYLILPYTFQQRRPRLEASLAIVDFQSAFQATGSGWIALRL